MTFSRRLRYLSIVLAAAAVATACNDVGDSTGGNGTGDDSGVDGTTQEGASGDDGSASETGAEGGTDGGGSPDGDATASPADSGEDGASSSPDSAGDGGNQTPDTGMSDASDAGAVDTGADMTVDTGTDATVDAGAETGVEASVEAGVESGPDATVDTGSETGSGVVPCTAVGQTNCVPCDGNTNSVCTPTEALIVNRDIAKGYVVDGGLDITASCYECMWNAGCIDDDVNIDSNRECGDLSGTVGAGAQASETKTAACLTTLGCIFSSGCQNAKAQNDGGTDGIANCYCGASFLTSSSCNNYAGSGATPAPNGSCFQDELDGLGLTSTASGATVLAPFTTRVSGSGMANAMLLCVGSNSSTFTCPSCF